MVVVVPSGNWHVGSVPDERVMGVGVPTAGVILTVLTTWGEVPHPLAVTLMSTLPEKPFAQVITPVEATIEPADPLLSDQSKPVLLAAVVEYVVVVVPFVS